ncbi:MAG: hypothetical protein ACE5FQ_10315 [Thiogranum sp.]
MPRLPLALLLLFFAIPAGAAREALLLERLRADHAALRAAQKDFGRHRQAGGLDAIEAREYAAYVERLRQRVASDCAALSAARIPVPADVDCPRPPPAETGPAPVDQQAEKTDAERAATLDAELNADLGEFDQRLLREQERVKAARPRTAGGGARAGTTDGGGQDGGAAGSGAAGVATGSRDNGAPVEPPVAGGAAGGSGQQPRAGGQPEDSTDGSGDDVVARQLREAAERETDPELKKKLWEEYRKYKQGTR